jgi:hypothetical protein
MLFHSNRGMYRFMVQSHVGPMGALRLMFLGVYIREPVPNVPKMPNLPLKWPLTCDDTRGLSGRGACPKMVPKLDLGRFVPKI